MPKCSMCEESLDVAEFSVTDKKTGRLRSACRVCTNKRANEHYHKNPDPWKILASHWAKRYPEKRRIITRRYRETHAKKRKAQQNAERQTVAGRLNHRLSNQIRKALKQGGKNGYRWEILVGYTTEQLKKHLEKQFTEGMTWSAFVRGDIHIDHIIPISAFHFMSVEDIQFQACWALKNLRPMWAKENMSKKNKLLEPFQQFLF